MYEHVLSGCAPKPLSSYLKALGVLRILGEQADPKIVGWWSAEGFRCRTKLDAKELEYFFTEKYAPTPIVAPWNGGSGFYPADIQDGIQAIEKSSDVRLETYRDVIFQIRSWTEMKRSPSTPQCLIQGLKTSAQFSKGKVLFEIENSIKLVKDKIHKMLSVANDIEHMSIDKLIANASNKKMWLLPCLSKFGIILYKSVN